MTHEDLKGGFIYYDARTNDARLTNEVIQQGVELGGTAINYLEAIFFEEEDGEIIGLTCKGRLKGWDLEIKAKQYISATGVWTDEFL
ncbi:MAG: FAD-dependent oxidoreductase [Bacteroidetes bacterium]|nr:FAD-dependent oxidoreductase [Bacteroidota bacterium]